MVRRHDITGMGVNCPALAVCTPHRRCWNRATINEDVISDVDTLPWKGRDSLDQRRNSAWTQTAPQIKR